MSLVCEFASNGRKIRMRNRFPLLICAIVSLICSTTYCDDTSAPEKRPNVLFILAEDQGPHAGVETPNIDRQRLSPTDNADLCDLMSDTWVATDSLGRMLPSGEMCRPPRADRTVGIFYFLWHGQHGTSGPYDISKILAADSSDPKWGPPGRFHHWGQPELGYYLADDPYVYRRHASMLADAGVDVAVIDVTNAYIYEKQVDTLCRTWMAMRREGNRTPQIAFLTHSRNVDTVKRLYKFLYEPGKYRPLWFQWQGKPLLMAKVEEELPEEIRDFFTFRESWAWSKTAWFGDGRDRWAWIDNSPQAFGWNVEGLPEQMPVAVGGHPVMNLGRSHHGGVQPAAPGALTDRGVYFKEQWDRALEVDPQFVFVTGWNEWVAQRFVKGAHAGAGSMCGQKLQEGDTYFVDQFDREFSRDIEPMRGGHGDNYYYQLVANIRRFKGCRPIPTAGPAKTIKVDGDFSDWVGVVPEYRDTAGDTMHRDHQGWGDAGRYVDNAGRNDIVALKATVDKQFAYFYAETREPITPPEGNRWMLLWIDLDGDSKTGQQGYDYVVNRHLDGSGRSSIEKLNADGSSTLVGGAVFAFSSRQLELALPIDSLQGKQDASYDFHWTDNVLDIGEFSTSADHAPNRRFNYRYLPAEK